MEYVFAPCYFRPDKNGVRKGCYGLSIISKYKIQAMKSLKCKHLSNLTRYFWKRKS
eukprot:UN29827